MSAPSSQDPKQRPDLTTLAPLAAQALVSRYLLRAAPFGIAANLYSPDERTRAEYLLLAILAIPYLAIGAITQRDLLDAAGAERLEDLTQAGRASDDAISQAAENLLSACLLNAGDPGYYDEIRSLLKQALETSSSLVPPELTRNELAAAVTTDFELAIQLPEEVDSDKAREWLHAVSYFHRGVWAPAEGVPPQAQAAIDSTTSYLKQSGFADVADLLSVATNSQIAQPDKLLAALKAHQPGIASQASENSDAKTIDSQLVGNESELQQTDTQDDPGKQLQPAPVSGQSPLADVAANGADSTDQTAIVDVLNKNGNYSNARPNQSNQASQSPIAGNPQGNKDDVTPPPTWERPNLWMVSDIPLDIPVEEEAAHDHLGFGAYANGLAGLINNPKTSTPLTLAINAPWGAGKSTLAAMMKRRLNSRLSEDHRPHIICDFNAWMHDDAPNLASSFAAEVARSANAHRVWWLRLINPLPIGMLSPEERRRRRILTMLCALPMVAVLTLLIRNYLLAHPEAIQWITKAFGGDKNAEKKAGEALTNTPEPVKSGAALLLSGTFLTAAMKLIETLGKPIHAISAYISQPEAAAANGSMREVRTQLGSLIGQATRGRSKFVIFVDDLERCSPPRAVDLLEVVNQLLDHPNVVTVLIGDMSTIAACVEMKYEAMLKTQSTPSPLMLTIPGRPGSDKPGAPVKLNSFGRRFLQKIIQIQFDLPAHDNERIRTLVQKLSEDPVKPNLSETETDSNQAQTGKPDSASINAPAAKSNQPAKKESVLAKIASYFAVAGLPILDVLRLYKSVQALQGNLGSISKDTRDEIFGSVRRAYRQEFSGLAYFGIPGAALMAGGLFIASHWPRWNILGILVASIGLILSAIAIESYRRLLRRIIDAVVQGFETTATQESLIRTSQDSQARGVYLNPEALKASVAADVSKKLQSLNVPANARPAPSPLSPAGSVAVNAAILDEQVNRFLVNETNILKQAYDEAFAYLPPLPRHAKRLLNQLRLLLHIAIERDMFAPSTKLLPQHIGRWVVLRERWPDLAQAILEQRISVSVLESCQAVTDLPTDVKGLLPSHEYDDLVGFFSSPIKLDTVIAQIYAFGNSTRRHDSPKDPKPTDVTLAVVQDGRQTSTAAKQ